MREGYTVAVTTSTKNKMNLNEATPAIKCKMIFIIKLPVLVNLKRNHLIFMKSAHSILWIASLVYIFLLHDRKLAVTYLDRIIHFHLLVMNVRLM